MKSNERNKKWKWKWNTICGCKILLSLMCTLLSTMKWRGHEKSNINGEIWPCTNKGSMMCDNMWVPEWKHEGCQFVGSSWHSKCEDFLMFSSVPSFPFNRNHFSLPKHQKSAVLTHSVYGSLWAFLKMGYPQNHQFCWSFFMGPASSPIVVVKKKPLVEALKTWVIPSGKQSHGVAISKSPRTTLLWWISQL